MHVCIYECTYTLYVFMDVRIHCVCVFMHVRMHCVLISPPNTYVCIHILMHTRTHTHTNTHTRGKLLFFLNIDFFFLEICLLPEASPGVLHIRQPRVRVYVSCENLKN